MILASAGSGKTYALTSRFVQLLADGAPPERIVALTFTRKAAGEFFDEILKKLAEATRDDASARALAAQIERPALGRRDFLTMLRRMVDAMHRLRLGTLDSFFARIARTFPLELGLAGEFEVLQDHAAEVERRRVLRRMFARTGGGIEAAQTEFIEAFKRATFGAEEKQLGARLDAFLDEHQEQFLAAPEESKWGDPARIWRESCPWLGESIKVADAIRDLRATLGPLSDGQRERWDAFFAALAEWSPGGTLPKPVEYILKNALAAWPDVCRGQAQITVERRKLDLPERACHALKRLITHIVGAELRRHLETTRGIFAVLRGYEALYHDAVRRQGRLTFADVQRLLMPDSGAPLLSGDLVAARPESGGDAGERRLLIDYRLDSEIDHWLLDEFQDTSFGQWSVLRNLIDEVVQDPEGRRTFFCVGDVKQAIYAWREGDPRLFREIFDHYNRASPGAIEERHLVASYRSGPAVIEMVNAVFGASATLAELFPGEAAETWNGAWRDHESAKPGRTGQAALLHAEDEEGRWNTALRLIQEINPLARDLTCAVLVRKNDTATALADYLRRAGIAAIAESDLHVATDNPVGAVLLALVQAAAHPGDTLAQEHVRMTPLGGVLDELGLTTPDALTGAVLARIHADGFERAVEFWVGQLEPRLGAGDVFSRRRAREFVSAARLFDATGSRDVGEFIAFMERHTVRAPESAAVVRVMTVHKSKGLGFHVVILPDLQGDRIDQRRDGLAVQKAPDRSVEWILDLPPKLFCSPDEVLSKYLQAAEADGCYESLSLLYVALTRAKRAMYVVTEPVGTSKSRNFPKLLAETLGDATGEVRVGAESFAGAWCSGDPEWHRGITATPADGEGGRAARLEPVDGGAPRLARRIGRRPSGGPSARVPVGALFGLDAASAAEFGTALHAALAEIAWLPDDVPAKLADWRARGVAPAVVDAAEAVLRAPTLRSVWGRPAMSAEVWRERMFEIVLDDAWVTGVFDRVVIERDENGRARRAVVYDFKTDRIASEEEVPAVAARYAEQLNLYRRVAGVLTGLEPRAIECRLVLTQRREAVAIAPDAASLRPGR